MISLLSKNYSLLNVIVICLQIFSPLILYLVSFFYVSRSQSEWMTEKEKKFTTGLLTGTKGLFFGSVSFIFIGIGSLLVLDYFYRKHLGENNNNFTTFNYLNKMVGQDSDSFLNNIHFFVFPIMTILSILGRPISYQSNSFLTEFIFIIISAVMNLYLMYFYSVKISYVISIVLIPLFIWQIINVVAIYPIL